MAKKNNNIKSFGPSYERIMINDGEEANGRTKVHLTHPDGGLYPCMWLDSNGQVKEDSKSILVSAQEILAKNWSIVPGWSK
jgi:hypothetical protein